jgi:SAM-dependent methyltransferase
VDYVEGHMRSLPWTQHFDRVVNWFIAFGYFDDPDNRRVLTQIAQVLKPGGRVAREDRQSLTSGHQPLRS